MTNTTTQINTVRETTTQTSTVDGSPVWFKPIIVGLIVVFWLRKKRI